MANFNTHVSCAAAGSGLLAVLCLQVGLVTQPEALLLALVGTLGGILPDIDLQHSYPSRLLFAMLGIFSAFLLIFSLENQLSIVELWLVGIGTFALVRLVLWKLFHQYTTHRGSVHSLVVAVLSLFSVSAASYHLLNKPPIIAWLLGFFIFLNFILHLVLDEIYSVDFSNRRIKRSFGTALKLVDQRKPVKSTLLIFLSLLIWFLTPEITPFLDTLFSPQAWGIIHSRLLP
ncbi:MAG TPA: metal-dependent hydrolase [Thiolinea sp.]|nr:metal-dependent hydrolase [Thiolinea sp.]